MASGAQADIWGMTLRLLANATAECISFWMALGILGKAIGNERSARQRVTGDYKAIQISRAAHQPQIVSVLLHQNLLKASWMFVFQYLRNLKTLNHLTAIHFSR